MISLVSISYWSILLILFLFLSYKQSSVTAHTHAGSLGRQPPGSDLAGSRCLRVFSMFLIHAVRLPSEGPPSSHSCMLRACCQSPCMHRITWVHWHSKPRHSPVLCTLEFSTLPAPAVLPVPLLFTDSQITHLSSSFPPKCVSIEVQGWFL